ncbi:multiple epidermal growth factor-like domains protein 6 isoform X2 [Ostrea edulis]|uniref:multiple epidermal growth factor-like domains protein 6 isoform X2 n=1 Tax=Ostrea edulis TaxID=37623 RepID=UPI0024AEC413|nr:multiple epidermal growth factor-like domains protein 6 isoform X2 [Ostrea edulis]
MWKSGYMYFLYFGICVLLPSSESLNKTNGGNCGTNGEINCCHNYYQAKNTCVECPNGTYGRNCSLNCSENTYGKNCLKLCNCKPDETCDSKSGTCSVKPGYCRNGTRTVETPCCNNYLYVNTTCTKCPIGTYGFNCSQICSSGYYGKLCIKQCECQPNETCDPKHGCKDKGKVIKVFTLNLYRVIYNWYLSQRRNAMNKWLRILHIMMNGIHSHLRKMMIT